ncbi:hypothetical protein HN388_03240 [bacterium]|jgi:hypothetical protein|nr:hypothetical protein [bacterium]MBT4291449.1 hypothetical protein [bacterium]MBT7310236.1 hypothetical protein [bacterium]
MERKLSSIATIAALSAVLFSLWKNYGLFITVKRALFAYLVFYGIAALSVMIYKAGINNEEIDTEQSKEETVSNIGN